MSTAWKVLIALALLLPVGGYVAGSLAASSTEPTPRPPIVLDSSPVEPTPTTTPTPSPSPDGQREDREDDRGEDDGDDRRDDRDDDDIEVIVPTPGDVDDDPDDGDDGDDRDEREDDDDD